MIETPDHEVGRLDADAAAGLLQGRDRDRQELRIMNIIEPDDFDFLGNFHMEFLEVLNEVGCHRVVETDDAVRLSFQQRLAERGLNRVAHANV